MGYFSNGTEGAIYEDRYCSRCIHSDLGPGKEIGVDKPCPIWMMHLLYAYELCNEKDHPGKVMLDTFIPLVTIKARDGIDFPDNGECVMFTPRDAGSAIEGQIALELES